MKLVLCFANLLFAGWALAQSADRAAIESLIAALNDHTATAASLCTTDAASDSAELARLESLDRMLSVSEEPLSEVSAPKIAIRSVRFITPEVAVVDAANKQYGSVILSKSVPLLLIMKKEAGNWRIAAFRGLTESPAIPPAR